MAWSDGGGIGTGGSTANNQTALTVATTAAIGATDLVVIAVTVDNRVSGGGDDTSVSGVTIGGVALTKARQEATNVAAQAGASVSLWYGVPGALSSGVNMAASFTTASTSDASALSGRKFGLSVGSPGLVNTNGTTSATATPGSLNVTTANESCLRVRAIGCEYDATQTLSTTDGTWTAWAEGSSSGTGTVVEQVIEVEFKISTGTGDASNPGLGTACDNASVYAAFNEVANVLMGQAML